MVASRAMTEVHKARPQMRMRFPWAAMIALGALGGCNEQNRRPDTDPPPPTNFLVTIAVTGPGIVEDLANGVSCSTSCEYSFPEGQELNLTQRANDGAHFTAWSGECSGAAGCAVSVTGPTSVGAAFALDDDPPPPGTFLVTITVTGPGIVEDSANSVNCSGSCEYSFPEGQELNLTQRANDGAHFTAWSGQCSGVAGCAVSVTGPTNIGAAFAFDDDPPPPPPPGEELAKLLDFAETWDRNWNFGGHTVTAEFTEDYGYWEYDDATFEPWLFDRPTVGYRLYELTGDTRWRDKFLSDFAWYRERIDAQGIFTPKGSDDTKYGYVTPFLLYEQLTGDQQFRPVAKRIYDSWVREWSTDFQPDGSDQLWTEREIAFALEAAIGWYQLSGDAAALNRATAIVQQWKTAAGTVGAPLVTYTQHEGGGPGGTTPQNLTNSPWMSALYFQALRRYYALTNDAEALSQISKYADWCDGNCYYDAALAHVQYSGLVFPRYLTGELIGDAGYDYGNMGHCLDIQGLLKFAIFAKEARGESLTGAQTRYAQMEACAEADFVEWTRDTEYLPKYRVNPPRKFNWQLRGFYEDAQFP